MRCGKNYWPAVAFTFCATFKRVINRPKTALTPTIFVQGSAREKTYKLLSIRGFILLIRENNYETAVICQLLARWRQLLIRWKKYKWSKQTKKGSKPNFLFCSFLLVQLPNFLRKKISHFTIPLSWNPKPYIN